MTMAKKATDSQSEKVAKKICGIIMPISCCTYKDTEYTAAHWESMRRFLEDAIRDAGFTPRAVWEDESQSIIQGRIVNNIAEFDLAICVICGMNHNVLIELGLRLMTDKPVLVIHDDNNVSLPFDVNSLKSFKMPVPNKVDYVDYQDLKEKIHGALSKMAEPGYKSFLSFYKQIVPKSASKVNEVELSEFMNETRSTLQNLRTRVDTIARGDEALGSGGRSLRARSSYFPEIEARTIEIEKELGRLRSSPESTREDYAKLAERARSTSAELDAMSMKRLSEIYDRIVPLGKRIK